MALVVIVTVGTRGDVVPYASLGSALVAAGHQVTMVTHPSLRGFVADAGLGFAAMPVELGDGPITSSVLARRLAARWLHIGRSIAAAASGADLLLLSPMGMLGYHVAEAAGVASMGVYLQPLEATRAFPPALLTTRSLGGWGNAAAARVFRVLGQLPFARQTAALRAELGLPRLGPAAFFRRLERDRWPILYGISPSVVPPPPDWPAHRPMTGYWWPIISGPSTTTTSSRSADDPRVPSSSGSPVSFADGSPVPSSAGLPVSFVDGSPVLSSAGSPVPLAGESAVPLPGAETSSTPAESSASSAGAASGGSPVPATGAESGRETGDLPPSFRRAVAELAPGGLPARPAGAVSGLSSPGSVVGAAGVAGGGSAGKRAGLSGRLRQFLDAGEPPVFVGFGSMTAPGLSEVVGAAAARLGRRVVVQRGAAGLSAERRADVLVVDEEPHALLFPRVAVVVHHGGAGTTAAALRAGVPSVCVPFTADQPFWAERLLALGAAPPPVPLKKLTADRLASAIDAAEGCRPAAEAVSRRLVLEDGLSDAVARIKRLLS